MESSTSRIPRTGGGLPRTPVTRPLADPVEPSMLPPVATDISTPTATRTREPISGRSTPTRTDDMTRLENRFVRMAEIFQNYIGKTLSDMTAAVQMQGDCVREASNMGGYRRHMPEAPPRFEGKNPRAWLAQMEGYYNALNYDDATRLENILSFLSGRALSYWYTTQEQTPHLLPKTWLDFRKFMIARFSGRTVGATINLLKAVRFKGDFEEVANQFADILAEGEHPPVDLLKNLFLSRFPYEMALPVLEQDVETWTEARELMRERRGWCQERALNWYELAPPELRRRVEQNPNLREEGWLPMDYTPFREGERAKADYRLNKGSNGDKTSGQFGQTRASVARSTNSKEVKCFVCEGSGHIARDCPNNRLETKRNGQRCHKCGGNGHWASACPSKPGSIKGKLNADNGGAQPAVKREHDTRGSRRGNGVA